MANLESSKRPNRIKDITLQTFGRLTAIAWAGIKNGKAMWECECSCGKIILATGNNLRRGLYKSCGCHKSEMTAVRNAKHLMHGTSEYRAWRNAKNRCFNRNNSKYPDYGGRGITMCLEWRHDFSAFLKHIGPQPEGTTLDRIDNDKGYEPNNVRWASDAQQRGNKRPRRWAKDPRNT